MIDIIFVGSLLIGFFSIKCFADWCEKQVNRKHQ